MKTLLQLRQEYRNGTLSLDDAVNQACQTYDVNNQAYVQDQVIYGIKEHYVQ